MNQFGETIVTVASGIIGVAIVAILVSRKSQTPQVIQAAGSAFGNPLGVAESPVTGLGYNINLSYPSGGLFGYSPTLGGGFSAS